MNTGTVACKSVYSVGWNECLEEIKWVNSGLNRKAVSDKLIYRLGLPTMSRKNETNATMQMER